MTQIRLNNHLIARGKPPFIVAEAGINHNGSLQNAFKMIRLTKKCGIDAIKFQTFRAEEFIATPSLMYTYKSQGKKITESMLKMFKRYEFSRNEWFKIKQRCDDENILFLSTPQNPSDLDLLLELDISAIKIGSDDLTNMPLLKYYASTKLPIILSCGMSTLAEVKFALQTIGALKNYPTVLLVTTSQYPTPINDVNLLRFKTLSNSFPMIPFGFSDHTQGILAASLAVAFGATVFEKHFTLDHNMAGPDHWFSANPQELREWVNSIRKSYTMLGSPLVRPTQSEKKVIPIARRTIVALRNITKDETFNSTNIGLRRIGKGLPPALIEQIYGMKSTKKINKGSILERGDFR